MCALDHHPWGLPTGLDCTGVGEPHAVVFVASDAPDVRHQENASDAEWRR